tara:strand:+ start:109 stop:1608 length:1500 start_codon:yes stop_codon:yes gene_type:complete
MPSNNIHNKTKYSLKENIAFKRTNQRFQDALDVFEPFTEEELDNIIEDIIKTTTVDDMLEPFSRKIIPKGSNSNKTKRLYYNKKYYYNHAFPKGQKPGSQDVIEGTAVDDQSKYQGEARNIFAPFNTIDFNHEKAFYGRIDTNNHSIYPSEKFLSLVNGTTDVMLLDFVCDALNEMLAKIDKLKESKKISQDSIFYGIKIHKGWTSFVADHHNTMRAIFEGFVSKFANNAQNSMTIYKFSDYSYHFISFLGRFLSKFPISRTNLQLRSTTSPRISGIVFEMSNEKHDDDEKKYVNYILDKHFLQIQNIANGYGFMVDRNAPWRFIADLESPQMKARMADKGFGTLQEMFDARYYKTHLYELNSLKNYFFSFYDSFIESYPYFTEVHKCGDGAKAKVLYRKKREKDPFTNRKLLEYYYFIRAKECFKDWNQETFDHALEEAWQVFDHYGFVEALNHINDKTTHIYGDGGNPGIKTKKDEKNRIFFNHQPSYKRNSFSIKI